MMNKYEFTLFLNGVDEMTEDLANALYDAGCDDASPASCDGIVWLTFHRESHTLEAAIRSAVADVQRAGFHVVRLEMIGDALDDLLVTAS